ncbi:DUF3306 domain-containing protein [Pukyongiella litopenaei]|uniref:DUF3306 domain-containing protein n=1 Tax=Pukyongiella litopenaei TaxID=2605946 RepID=A0A2S0MKI1_9RHOB|nr:DUF3306 domain-containing protein [Pukyongiella litopenaei]AVO36398.1 DUF3306 domain-containing protein [Pukyongiella litopenaei]
MTGRREETDFWTRRRAAVAAETAAEAHAQEQHALDAEQARQAARSDDELLAELDLPDPDTLQPGDDVSGFMARAVPHRLRRRALRRLWRLNPVLANVDGLVDYGEDYTDAATVIDDLQSAYQVGKGMLARLQDMDRQDDTPPPDPADAAPIADGEMPDAPADPAAAAPATEPLPPPLPETARADAPAETDEFPLTAPRRMRFTFHDEA